MNGRLGALRPVLETPPQEPSRYLVLSALRVSPVLGFVGDETGVTGLFEFNVE